MVLTEVYSALDMYLVRLRLLCRASERGEERRRAERRSR